MHAFHVHGPPALPVTHRRPFLLPFLLLLFPLLLLFFGEHGLEGGEALAPQVEQAVVRHGRRVVAARREPAHLHAAIAVERVRLRQLPWNV
jgi:hypothetical protein